MSAAASPSFPLPGNPWTAGPCTICGDLFISPHYADRTCSAACRTRHQTHAAAARKARRRLAIAARDQHACRLCGQAVDMTLPYTDPFGPSLDHRTPRAAGGPGTQDNLQLAHRVCNTAKAALTGEDAAAAVTKARRKARRRAKLKARAEAQAAA
jgi:5-methylcytosine-specific restriction endonuclease McrA